MNTERPRLPSTTTPTPRFAKEDKKKLEELEAKVERSAMDLWRNLAEIKNYKEGLFWKDRYDSFAGYVKARFNYGEQHAYRLVAAGDFISELEASTKKIPLPEKEIQVRHIINKIPESRRIQCWEEITQKYKPEEWTGDVIEAEVIEFRKTIPKDELKAAKPASRAKTKKKTGVREVKKTSKDLLERLKKAVSSLTNAADILKGIKKVEDLIG